MSENSLGSTESGPEAPDMRQQRLAKVAALEAAGIPAYAGRVEGRSTVASVLAAYDQADAEDTVAATVAGRLTAKRIMGKSVFCDLRDQSGRLQLYARRNDLGPAAFELFTSLDVGDIVRGSGTVFRTRTGEVSLRLAEFELLSKSMRPLPEKWHGLTDVEQRYRQRYLDLISNEDVRTLFAQRCRIVSGLRRFLEDRDFTEVETPMLQPLAGGAAARPFETYYAALGCPMFLRIAPELYLKRLLVGGFERIFEMNRNFRNEGISRRHNPEFTMVEIYIAYADCRDMMRLVEELVTALARDVLGTLILERPDGTRIDLTPPWQRRPYAELLTERMGPDWPGLDLAAKCTKARELELDIPAAATAVEVEHEIYEKIIEPTLIQPTFVTRLPAELVPLAKRSADDPTVVDVFELEVNGQELAPGYSELSDPLEQRRRLLEQTQHRDAAATAAADSPLDEDFLTALEHGMPPAGGMGIGVDRLVMLLTGAESIRDVILFPQLRPLR